MTSDGDHRESEIDFGPFLQRFLAGDEHALETLPAREHELALTLAPAFEPEPDTFADSASTVGQMTPIDLDPIAIAIGLVPGPEDVLSSDRLQSARKAAGMDLGELLRRLQQRGWSLTAAEVFRWHSVDSQLPPALIKAIADTLNTPVRGLRGAPNRTTSFGAYLDDATIENFLAEWATEIGGDPAVVRDRAHRTLASLSFRNQANVSRDDVLAILRALRRIDPGGASG